MDSTRRLASLSDWARAADAPSLWPVEGNITSSFGERVDPFNGEGAFHSGLDISVPYGTPIHAAADGVVVFADIMNGYGNLIELDHGHGISTRYGHLSGFAITAGQHVRRGQVIGYVGATGRATSPHLHYEVRVQNVPVNPHKYLRTTTAQLSQQGQHLAAPSSRHPGPFAERFPSPCSQPVFPDSRNFCRHRGLFRGTLSSTCPP